MIKSRLGLVSPGVLGFALLCLLLSPLPAAADQIQTYGFTGIAGGSTVTGTFDFLLNLSEFPPASGSIVGPWEFSTPFGVISSATAGASTLFFTPPRFAFAAREVWGFLDFSSVSSTGQDVTAQLAFALPALGSLVTEITENTPNGIVVLNHPSFLSSSSGATLDFTSGAVSPVPEPPSLLLLGTAMLGCAPLIRWRFWRT